MSQRSIPSDSSTKLSETAPTQSHYCCKRLRCAATHWGALISQGDLGRYRLWTGLWRHGNRVGYLALPLLCRRVYGIMGPDGLPAPAALPVLHSGALWRPCCRASCVRVAIHT